MSGVDESVRSFVNAVTPEKRRRDAETLLGRVTGESPRMWGTLVGFGEHHYRYASGREGDTAAVGFAPRKAATTVYLVDGVQRYAAQLQRLGPHKTGVGCLYLRDLAEVDLTVLEDIVAESYRTTAGHSS